MGDAVSEPGTHIDLEALRRRIASKKLDPDTDSAELLRLERAYNYTVAQAIAQPLGLPAAPPVVTAGMVPFKLWNTRPQAVEQDEYDEVGSQGWLAEQMKRDATFAYAMRQYNIYRVWNIIATAAAGVSLGINIIMLIWR